jgi:methylated-DNA-protein-cysteine methyltransferase-like protein
MASSKSGELEHVRALYARIYEVARGIPRGRVATYGQIAELAGIPGGARVAGAAMKTSTPGDRLPWQRVIGKAGKGRGRIAIYDPVGAAIQRGLLERERVEVGETGLVDLRRYGWLPGERERGRERKREREREREPEPEPEREREPVRAGSTRGASPRRRPRSGSKRRALPSRR